MDSVAALKALGVLLAGVVAWLGVAVAALEVLFRVTAPRSGRLPADDAAPEAPFQAAPVAIRSSASHRQR